MMQISDNMRGAAFMTGSMVAFTVNDAFMKMLSGDIPLFQALFLRGLGTVVFLVVLAIVMGQFRFNYGRKDWMLIGLRSLAEIGGTVCFLTALFHMPIANVTAVLQALPLTVALAAAVFLREPLGWRRLSAILVGLAGVVLIVRPGGDGFTVYSIYALGAVACVTLRDLVVRRMSQDVPSIIVGLMAAIAVMLAGAVVTATQPWVPVDGTTGLKLAGAMLFIVFGYIFSVAAMRTGEIAFVASFRYSGLLSALILGWAIFGDWPVPVTLLGAAIVVATGLFTLYRERQLSLKKQLSPRLR
ncbi:MAG: drug/metabolite transporter (DMT)-like permease [Reinekea sp.]|jgi:S-adenosylmethionine uptake transporter